MGRQTRPYIEIAFGTPLRVYIAINIFEICCNTRAHTADSAAVAAATAAPAS